MKDSIVYIKNMVCPRCISAIESVLDMLKIEYSKVELGQIYLKESLADNKLSFFESEINKIGFELLESSKSVLISRIKTIIIEQIHYQNNALKVNYSTLLSEKLNYEYTYLSHLFSSIEGVTIEKFITSQKIERVKELLFYNQLSLSEIAFQLDYSSVAYLSNQFKKETGMTPSAFKKDHLPKLKALDAL
ncbi:MAG: AraC family transcriptional regulator [Bacteroidetes bacterium]|nr:AraC family transcriptional regulator [Bacteroidota bacterium]